MQSVLQSVIQALKDKKNEEEKKDTQPNNASANCDDKD